MFPVLLSAQFEIFCGGFNDWIHECFSTSTLLIILSLISYRYADKKMRSKIESKFQHEGLSWFSHWWLLPWQDHHDKPLFNGFRYYDRYYRSLFTDKIRRAADQSWCVPSFCVLWVQHDGVIQHQTRSPFEKAFWAASNISQAKFSQIFGVASFLTLGQPPPGPSFAYLHWELIFSKVNPISPNFAQRREKRLWSQSAQSATINHGL